MIKFFSVGSQYRKENYVPSNTVLKSFLFSFNISNTYLLVFGSFQPMFSIFRHTLPICLSRTFLVSKFPIHTMRRSKRLSVLPSFSDLYSFFLKGVYFFCWMHSCPLQFCSQYLLYKSHRLRWAIPNSETGSLAQLNVHISLCWSRCLLLLNSRLCRLSKLRSSWHLFRHLQLGSNGVMVLIS